MSRKIVRILGEKGRITIPYAIRVMHGIRRNDVLSFEDAGEDLIILRRERLYSDRIPEESGPYRSDERFLKEQIDSLSDAQKRRLYGYLRVGLKEKERRKVYE